MYQKFVDLIPNAIFMATLCGLGAISNLLCLGSAWAFNAQMILRLWATMLDCHSTVFLHQHVNHAPKAITGLALVQIITIALIACMTCAVGLMDAVHVTGKLIIAGYAVWAICGAGRDATGLIKTVTASDMMSGCLMIEKENWFEQPSRLNQFIQSLLIWLKIR